MEVYLDKIETYRHPTAHHREYLPHEADLVKGISGEIRAMISAYKKGKSEEAQYFPTIEYVKDSLGNVAIKSKNMVDYYPPQTLRPGDSVDFVIQAWDPFDEPLEYQMRLQTGTQTPRGTDWSEDNTFRWKVLETDISKSCSICFSIRSKRDWHAAGFYDGALLFHYKVLPKERPK